MFGKPYIFFRTLAVRPGYSRFPRFRAAGLVVIGFFVGAVSFAALFTGFSREARPVDNLPIPGRGRSWTPLELDGYAGPGERIVLDGVANASGIAWSPVSRTLFVVTNAPTAVLELGVDGEVSRGIELSGFKDTEGISHVSGGIFAVVEEGRRTVCLIEIKPDTRVIHRGAVEKIWLGGLAYMGNDGLEGVACVDDGESFLLVKEKNPSAFYALRRSAAGDCEYSECGGLLTALSPRPRDLSDICHTGGRNTILALSHESRVLFELSPGAELIGSLDLSWMIQPEGVAVDDGGTLYVCGEPNVIHKLAPPCSVAVAR